MIKKYRTLTAWNFQESIDTYFTMQCSAVYSSQFRIRTEIHKFHMDTDVREFTTDKVIISFDRNIGLPGELTSVGDIKKFVKNAPIMMNYWQTTTSVLSRITIYFVTRRALVIFKFEHRSTQKRCNSVSLCGSSSTHERIFCSILS